MLRTISCLAAICLIMLALFACGNTEKPVDNPRVGTEVNLASPLFVVKNSGTGLTESATDLDIGYSGLTLSDLTSCAGCRFRSLSLEKFLPSRTRVKITRAYRSKPPFLHIGSSPLDYFLVQADNLAFAISVYRLENALTGESFGREEKKMAGLLDSFSHDGEKKTFYIHARSFTRHSAAGIDASISSEDVQSHFSDVFAEIGQHNITGVNAGFGQMAFSLTTDRDGLAWLILKTREKYAEISEVKK